MYVQGMCLAHSEHVLSVCCCACFYSHNDKDVSPPEKTKGFAYSCSCQLRGLWSHRNNSILPVESVAAVCRLPHFSSLVAFLVSPEVPTSRSPTRTGHTTFPDWQHLRYQCDTCPPAAPEVHHGAPRMGDGARGALAAPRADARRAGPLRVAEGGSCTPSGAS